MNKVKPDHRYRAVDHASEAPAHPIERALWELLHRIGTDLSVARAGEIYFDVGQREVLQGWIVAGATDAQVETIARVPTAVTAAFRHLFFDVAIFRDDLELLSWVNSYEKNGGTPFGGELLRNAIMHGVDYLRWTFGRGEMDLDPNTVIKRAMTDAYFRGRMNRGHALSSKEAAAAHGFLKTAASLATQLGKTGAPNVNDIIIKLKHRDMTEKVEDVAVKEQILH